jgi:hypothetical protein
MFNNNIEKIEKADNLPKWREKINNAFSMFKNIFPNPPKDKNVVLTSNNGDISWSELPKPNDKPISKLEDLGITGILSTEHIVVNNVAIFKENIEVNRSIIAKSLVLQHNPLLKFVYSNYYQPTINPTEEGLKIDGITVKENKITLGQLYFKHCHIETTDTSLIFRGKNNNTPFAINFEDNVAYCANGIISPAFYFDKKSFISQTEYTGNAKSASKLKKQVNIYGNAFDGSKNLSGILSDCGGIKFSSENSFIEFPSKTNSTILENVDGTLIYTGEFSPKKLHLDTEHYAEYYPSNTVLEKGDVISLDFKSNNETYTKVNSIDGHPLGVVTDDYAMIIGEKKNNSYPVCNKGRVHAKVIGAVKHGDNLTISLNEGILRKLQPKEKLTDTWAIALESSENEGIKLIKIHII